MNTLLHAVAKNHFKTNPLNKAELWNQYFPLLFKNMFGSVKTTC